MVDMTDILNRAASTVEPPKQLPAGQYLFRVMGYSDKDAEGKPLVTSNGNPRIEFQCQAETPIEVDSSQLEGVNFPVKMRHTFVVTENSLFRLVAFLSDHLGIPKDNNTVSGMLPQTTGHMFRGTVVHRSGTKPGDTNLYANISETFPAS